MDSSVLFVTPYLQDGRSVAKMLDDISVPVVHAANLTEAAAKLKTGRFKACSYFEKDNSPINS